MCLLVATPMISKVYEILFSNSVPAGGDPADHSLFVLRILASGMPLIEYSQFPPVGFEEISLRPYYPSFLHVLIALPTMIFHLIGVPNFDSVVISMTSTIFVSYLVGVIGYGLVGLFLFKDVISKFKRIVQLNNISLVFILSLFSFSVFMYSTGPIIKTLRDGGYGEIFAMWTLFPFYILMLIRKNLVTAGILFGLIASTHNISAILTILFSVSYFGFLITIREYGTLRKMWILCSVAFIASIPAIAFFYYPAIVSIINGESGLSSTVVGWSRADIADQLGVQLYYLGIVAIGGVLFINYRSSGWLVGWIIIYFLPFSFNLLFLERVARELSIPFGLVIGTFFSSILYLLVVKGQPWIVKRIPLSQTFSISNWQVVSCSVILVAISAGFYLVNSERIEQFGDPFQLNYYSDTVVNLNAYLMNQENPSHGSILSYGVNPWTKPFTFSKYAVYEVETEDMEKTLSKKDRMINEELRMILEDPTSSITSNILSKYNISYIVLADVLPDRWYSDSQRELTERFARFEELNDRTIIKLDHQWVGEDGAIYQVYSVVNGRDSLSL